MLQPKKHFWGKKPGFDIGDVLHVLVNISFVAVIYLMVQYWHLAYLAVVIIFLSKWRVLAVQPRFWLPNIKANMVDLIVGVSTVALIASSPADWIAIFWTVLYIAWLLFLKPREHNVLIGIQALWGVIIGMIAVFTMIDFIKLPVFVVALVWIVSWASARHFFSDYEEPHYRTLSIVWALMAAEIAWFGLHWVQYYFVFDVKISVVAVIIAILSLGSAGIYHSYKHNTLNKAIIVENVLFVTALLAVVMATSGWVVKL